MKRATALEVCLAAILRTVVPVPAAAQELPVILDVQVENSVLYVGDVTDLSRLARSPVPVALLTQAQLGNFTRSIFLADVTAINGTPAKGVRVELVRVLRDGTLANGPSLWTETNADGGFAMRDVPASQFVLGVNVGQAITAEAPWAAEPGRRPSSAS